jgi:hypothetical protein
MSVQYRRAGTTQFTTAYVGKSSAQGAFTAFLMPRAAGTWQFRLFVPPTSVAKGLVSPVRTVKASGRAVATKIGYFASTPATVTVGGTVRGHCRSVAEGGTAGRGPGSTGRDHDLGEDVNVG